MNIKIIKNSKLTKKQVDDVNKLYITCNSHDKTKYSFDIDNDFSEDDDINTFLLYLEEKLVSSINIFAPTKNEAEIVALTLPEQRRKKYFYTLLQEAITEIKRRNIQSILFVCDARSIIGIKSLESMMSKYEYSEYLLIFTNNEKLKEKSNDDILISIADIKDREKLIKINSEAFKTECEATVITDFFKGLNRKLYSIKYLKEVVGMIGVYKEESRNYIFGFCIDPKFQNKGIGSYTLSAIVKKFLKDNKDVVLEVQADNLGALSVYQNIGFTIEAEFKYFRYTIMKNI